MKYVNLILLFVSTSTFAQTTYIPDDNFEQALIDLGLDDVLDDYVLTENIETVSTLYLTAKGIHDFQGIEDFEMLQHFECGWNTIDTLDLTGNSMLNYLDCFSCHIKEINLSNNPNLAFLYCNNNELTTIDLTANINLVEAQVGNNHLTSIQVIGLSDLQVLGVGKNFLSEIDLTTNIGLTDLYLSDNLFTSVNLSENYNLNSLFITSNFLTDLDLSNNASLENLFIFDNLISDIDLTNNLNLTTLNCAKNLFSILDLSYLPALNDFSCQYNDNLTTLNIANGNNSFFTNFKVKFNPVLSCIQVDDVAYSTEFWTSVEDVSVYSINCGLSLPSNQSDQFLLYPNPAHDIFYISNEANFETYEIRDLTGRIIDHGTLATGTNQFILANYTTGLYFVSLKKDRYAITQKIAVE